MNPARLHALFRAYFHSEPRQRTVPDIEEAGEELSLSAFFNGR